MYAGMSTGVLQVHTCLHEGMDDHGCVEVWMDLRHCQMIPVKPPKAHGSTYPNIVP